MRMADSPGCWFSPSQLISRNGSQIMPLDLAKQIAASLLGSSASTLLLNPLHVLKLRLQYIIPKNNYVSTIESRGYVSVQSTALGVYKRYGITGFYAGVGISLFQSLPSTVIYMTTYERIKKQMYLRYDVDQNRDERNSGSQNTIANAIPALAGGLARIFTVTIISPVELIKTIRTSGSSKEKPWRIASDIIDKHGYRGLYSGWSSTILRDTPFSMIYWLSFENLRPIFSKRSGLKESSYSSAVNFLAGSSSGFIAALITHPFDVLKTQEQLSVTKINDTNLSEPVRRHICMEPGSNCGLRRRFLAILHEAGWKGLYRGLSMRLLTVIPSGAIMITVYELVKNT